MAIKTNRIKYTLKREQMEERFDIFAFKTTNKSFKLGYYTLDTPTLDNSVQSIAFEGSNLFYVMLAKNTDNFNQLRLALHSLPDGDTITISKVSYQSVKDYILLKLLLNAIPYKDVPILRYNNITGHLYYYHPEWLKKTSKNTIYQVPCMKITLTSDYKLKLSTHTFTHEPIKNKKGFENHPMYVFSKTSTTLVLKSKSDSSEDVYISKQLLHKKNTIPFMDISNISTFEQSKMGVLEEIIRTFNTKYENLAELDFSEIDEYISIENKSTFKSQNKKKFKQILKGYSIKIIDCVGDSTSSEFCKELIETFKSEYDITVTSGKRISKNYLNVRVIHNKEHYKGGTDAYIESTGDYAVQHVTIEDYPNTKVTAETIAHELVIKEDISKEKISLFNWESLNYTEDIAFGIAYEIDGIYRYFFMVVHPDGTFSIEEKQLDIFNLDTYTECVHIFKEYHGVKGIVRFGNGDINIIQDTNMFTIPDITSLHDELSNGNTALRNKEMRDEHLTSVVDIKCYAENNRQYYFVGSVGAGMQSKVDTAPLIRCIVPYNGSKLRFDELLPLMNVTFVRNGQLTVVPFPFKYLAEYIRTRLA